MLGSNSCKYGFPHDFCQHILDKTVTICEGLGKLFDVRVSGRRSWLGNVEGPMNSPVQWEQETRRHCSKCQRKACSDCHERLPKADYDESEWERKRDRKCRACKSKKRKNQDDDSSRKKQRVDNNSDDLSRKKQRVDRQSRSSRKAAKRQHP